MSFTFCLQSDKLHNVAKLIDEVEGKWTVLATIEFRLLCLFMCYLKS